MKQSLQVVSKAVISLRWLACAGLAASACGEDGGGATRRDAGAESDAERADTGRAEEDDADVAHDAAQAPGPDGGSQALDAGLDADTAEASAPEAGCDGAACPPGDPLAPFRLDCASLASGSACQGGPREVLLVTARTGHILMFDAFDGDFLGYFKREAADYNTRGISGFFFATQGPDQCIWSVSEAQAAGVQRWNPDGTFKDAPLEQKFLPVSGEPDEPAIQNPLAIAFSRERLFVASHYGSPYPRVTRWQLDGTFDGVALADELEVRSLLALGDGSLLVADEEQRRVVRIPAGGGQPVPVLGELTSPAQLSYSAAGKALAADDSSGEPIYEVEIESGRATAVYPAMAPDGVQGVAPLKNGKWLIAGGEYEVSVLDPASSNPSGQHQIVWSDNAVAPGDFSHIGRACLSESFVASRASKPADDRCIDPPAGAVIFEENFETGAFEGSGTSRHFRAFYDVGVAEVATSIDATGGFGGSRALKISGAGQIETADPAFPQRHKTGMFAIFSGAQPKYISYRVKILSPEQILGYLLLENAAANPEEFQWLAGTSFEGGVLSALESNAETATELANRWVRVELRNINWSARTYDLYVDCVRLAEGIGLPAGFGDAIDRIDVYNYPYSVNADTVAWYDDILIK